MIVFLQENKTTDFYFPTLAKWGAAVASHGKLLSAPPNSDQPHDRNAWVHFSMGDYPALPAQIDNDKVIPFYSWLAKQFVFCDHHFGAGSNSTPGHMLATGGQMPTLKNPPLRLGGHHLHPQLGRLGRLRRLGADAVDRDGPGRGAPGRLHRDRRLSYPADHVRWQGQADDRFRMALPRLHPQDRHRPPRPPCHGRAPGGHVPIPGRARGLLADPAPPSRA